MSKSVNNIIFCVSISFLFFITGLTEEKKENNKNSVTTVQPPNFIIPQEKAISKNASKRSLKEDIGEQMRDALYNCSELNKQIGKVQVELSKMQKQLFSKVEELIDNRQPFKSAGKQDLTNTFKAVEKIKNQLQVQAQIVKDLRDKLNQDKCLKLQDKKSKK